MIGGVVSPFSYHNLQLGDGHQQGDTEVDEDPDQAQISQEEGTPGEHLEGPQGWGGRAFLTQQGVAPPGSLGLQSEGVPTRFKQLGGSEI